MNNLNVPPIVDTIIGVIYVGLSWVLYAAPAKEIWTIRRKKECSQSPLPYILMVFNSMAWVALSLEDQDTVIFWTFVVGIWTSTFYGMTIYSYSSKKRLAEVAVLVGLIAASSIIFVAGYFLTHEQRVLLFGICGVTSSILVWTSPMLQLADVIKTRSSESMPLGLVAATAVCCVYWFLYGFYVDNTFVKISNGCGTGAGWLQLVIVFAYKPATIRVVKRILSPLARLLPVRQHSTSNIELPEVKDLTAEVTADKAKTESVKMQSVERSVDRHEGDAAMIAAEAAELAVAAAMDGVVDKDEDMERPPPLDHDISVIIDDAPLPSISGFGTMPGNIGVPSTAERSYEKFMKGGEYPTVEDAEGSFRLVVQ